MLKYSLFKSYRAQNSFQVSLFRLFAIVGHLERCLKENVALFEYNKCCMSVFISRVATFAMYDVTLVDTYLLALLVREHFAFATDFYPLGVE